MNVSDFIIDFLAEKGIKDIFLLYGGAIGDITDAFTRTDKTRYVCVMHEQVGGFAAEGYAKVSGKPGVMIATSGPGGHNLVTPIGNCFYDSVPAIFITGQVGRQFLMPNSDVRQTGFQETPIAEIVKPITKYAKMLTNPEDVRLEMEKAWHIATTGRPGPVLLDFPMDVQAAKVDLEKLVGFQEKKKDGDIDLVDKVIDGFVYDLSKAKRPVGLVGGGIRWADALKELEEVQRRMKIPFFPTWNALDVITSDSEFYGGRVGTQGGAGRNFGIQNSDLLLSVGSRISGRIPGGNIKSFARAAKKYVVDIDGDVLEYQDVPIDIKLSCDAKLFLERLAEKLEKEKPMDFSDWNKRVFEWRERYDPVKEEYFNANSNNGKVHPYAFVRILSNELQQGDICTADCGGNVSVFSQAFETKKGMRAFSSNGNSPMGFSFAGAIGSYVGSDRQHNVVSIIGDGGFCFNLQDLQTLKTYAIPVKTFILNNHCLGFTRQTQKRKYGGKTEACDRETGYIVPDLIAISKAFEIRTATIVSNDRNEITRKIREVLQAREAVVCDVDCGDFDDYQPRVFGINPIEDMWPYLPREEFRANMIIEPLEGWQTGEYKPM